MTDILKAFLANRSGCGCSPDCRCGDECRCKAGRRCGDACACG